MRSLQVTVTYVTIFFLLPISVKSEEGDTQANVILCGTENNGSFLESPSLPLLHLRAYSGRISFTAEAKEKKEPRSPDKADLSFEWRSTQLYLSAGSRFFPNPYTSFLRDNRRFSAFREIPSGKIQKTAFLSILPDYYIPGLFISEEQSTGIFLADPSNRFFAIWLPEMKTGAITLNIKKGGGLLFLDLLREKSDTTGFISTTYNFSQGSILKFEGERRSEWDGKEHDRRGKSGLASLLFEWDVSEKALLGFDLAGMDRGETGRRVVGIDGGIGKFLSFRPFFRIRNYSQRVYGSSADPRNKGAGGIGFAVRKKDLRFSAVAESREGGLTGAEIQSTARFGSVDISLSALRNFSKGESGSFNFIRLSPHYGSGTLFFDSGISLYALKIRSGNLYFLFQMMEKEGRPEHFSTIQFRITF